MDVGVFVGRERELAELGRRLAAARAGQGGLVLIEGEAGVGKTALAQVVARRAQDAGTRVAWGACLEGEGAPPYWPWLQILRDAFGSASLPVDLVHGTEVSRFQLFDEVVTALQAAAEPQGLVIVLDDLHWADVPSVRLLQVMASRTTQARVLVVALYRDQDAAQLADLGAALRGVARERSVTRLHLAGLSPAEAAELAAQALGTPIHDRSVDLVKGRAEGNPLFLLEFARLVRASGRLGARTPESVREVITRHLDRLSPQVRLLLRRASVIGRSFGLDLLAALAEEAPPVVFDSLEPAIAAGILNQDDGWELRFGHVLIRDVLYDELSPGDRQRLHARVSDVLAADDVGESMDALAYHLRQAAPMGLADEALRVTRLAAQRARAQLAYEHAASHYRAAIALLPLIRLGDRARAQLLLDLAWCEFRSGAVDKAWVACRAAADIGRAIGDATVLADAATVLRGVGYSPITAEIHALSREALARLDGTDAVREARLLAQLAISADRFASAGDAEWSERALRVAEATGDPDARFLAMQARHADLVDGRHVLERLSIGERAIRLGHEARNDEYTAWGHTWRIEAFWELGRRLQLDAQLTAFANVVGQLAEPLWRWRLDMMQAILALFEGRFADAAALAEQARDIGVRGGYGQAEYLDLVFRSHYSTLTGADTELVEAQVREEVAKGPYLARLWHAQLLIRIGRFDDAAALWDTVVPYLASYPKDAPEWRIAGAGNAELCVALGDRTTAALVYEALLPYMDHQIIGGAHTPAYGPASRYLGLLAALTGRDEDAEAHLRRALISARAMGSPPYEALTEFDLAQLLAQRRPRDPEASELLDAALRAARRLGMAPLVKAATALRGRQASALSAREEQVAALVAQGLSNRQIATRLKLSERTAENHVAHILTKLGFDSRSRIASWYATHQPED